ncbi:unnamed protein product, partial [Didymodactylos carnosus]
MTLNATLLPTAFAGPPNPMFDLNLYPIMIFSASSATNIIFSLLCLNRYRQQDERQTRFNYIFHYALLFSFMSAAIFNSGFIFGYYLLWFNYSIAYCRMYTLNNYAIYMGIPTSLFVFIPQCSVYVPCAPCFFVYQHVVLAWFAYSFFLPMLTMILFTCLLFYRLYSKRKHFSTGWSTMNKICSQMLIYILWYILAYWPFQIYRLLISYNSARFNSQMLNNILVMLSMCGIQTLPLLIYILYMPNKSTTRSLPSTSAH